jgi:uncharacterized protein (TIRG00374 family)
MKRKALAAAQAAVTIVLLILLFSGFDWGAFRALYLRLPLWFYAASLAAIVTGPVLYAWRWRVLLASGGIHLPFAHVLQQYLVGIFVNNFLPSTIGGDAAKAFYVGRHHGYGAVTTSLILDRLLGVGLLSLLATAALWAERHADPTYVTVRLILTGIAGVFVLALAVALAGTRLLQRRVDRAGGRTASLAPHLQRFAADMARAVRSPAVWLQSAATVAAYFVLMTLVYQGFIALQSGQQPGFTAVMMAVASAAVLTNIPITVNGLGLREQLHVLLLTPLGVPKEAAVAISLLLFGHVLLVSVAGGLVWWRLSRESARTVEA